MQIDNFIPEKNTETKDICSFLIRTKNVKIIKKN